MTVSPFVIVRCTFRGSVDSQTGYLVDIRRIDEALRRVVLCGESIADLAGDSAIHRIWHGLVESWSGPPEPAGVELEISPYLRFGVMVERRDMVRITQSYEFSASHRLGCPGFSEEENRAVFGLFARPPQVRGKPEAISEWDSFCVSACSVSEALAASACQLREPPSRKRVCSASDSANPEPPAGTMDH